MPTTKATTLPKSCATHASLPPPPTFFLDALTFFFTLESPDTALEEFLAVSRYVGKLRYSKHIDRDANGVTRIRSLQSLRNHRHGSTLVAPSPPLLNLLREPSLLSCLNIAIQALLTFFYTHYEIGMASEVEKGMQALRWYVNDCLNLNTKHASRILSLLSQWVQRVTTPPTPLRSGGPNVLMIVGAHYAIFWKKCMGSSEYLAQVEHPLATYFFKYGRIGSLALSRSGVLDSYESPSVLS